MVRGLKNLSMVRTWMIRGVSFGDHHLLLQTIRIIHIIEAQIMMFGAVKGMLLPNSHLALFVQPIRMSLCERT